MNKTIRRGILVAITLAGLMSSALAQQAPGTQSVQGLLGATPPSDWSVRMWTMLLGNFAQNPFSTLGGPSTLLGSAFLVFNSAIFTVGVLWAVWNVVGGVAQTAHEGEVLGRRMSTVWFPIRMFVGTVGMLPVFGGFTLFQAAMMFFTLIGIGIGNSIWNGAINNTAQFQGLMQDQAFTPTAASQVRQAAESLFISNVCAIEQQRSEAQMELPASERIRIQSTTDAASLTSSYQFGSEANPIKCGHAGVQGNGNARTSGSLTSFRAGGVNYDAYQQAAIQSYQVGMASMQSQVAALASSWTSQRQAYLSSGAGTPPTWPAEGIETVSRDFVTQVAKAAQNAKLDKGALTSAVSQNMKSLGWFGAGAWFSTFAEANAAMADAAKAADLKAGGPSGTGGSSSMRGLSSEATEAVSAAVAELQKSKASKSADTGSTGDTARALLDSAIQDSGCGAGALNSLAGTATGSCSLGQGIVSAAIRAAAIGSGGGGTGGGSLGFDQAGLVNPVIMMKNMGDYVMTFSSTLIMAGGAAWIADKVPFVGSLVGKVASKVVDSTPLGGIVSVLKTIAVITLVLGAAMAIYLPMVPFITWIGAILSYCASVIEGLAGASLHALSHLDGDGDGLGNRTTHGYLFMVNVIARPALMVMGFFVASALMIGVGTLQAHLFLPAMANVQGNSVTGLFSIIMFLLIFFVMNYTLITGSFNLIYVLTDQVIGFVGGSINSHLGRETEDKVNNMFMMGARVGPNAVGQLKKTVAEAGAGGAKGNKALGTEQ